MARSLRIRGWYLAFMFQFGLLLAGGGPVRAQNALPSDYTHAMEGAQREFSAANYRAALEQFRRADDELSTAHSQLGLGRSEFELRNYVRAIEHLKLALRSEVQPLDERTRPVAEELLKLAERSVGRFTIQSNAPEVEVSVDGDPVDLLEGRKLMLDPGPRLIEVGASDHESQRLQLMVKGGEDRKLSFALEREPPWYSDPWVWIGAGAILAGVTTAIVIVATSDEEGSGSNLTGMMPRLP